MHYFTLGILLIAPEPFSGIFSIQSAVVESEAGLRLLPGLSQECQCGLRLIPTLQAQLENRAILSMDNLTIFNHNHFRLHLRCRICHSHILRKGGSLNPLCRTTWSRLL